MKVQIWNSYIPLVPLEGNATLDFFIKQISPQETWPIRHQVMWPEKPITYVKLPNDDEGRHFGLFSQDKLIAVISLFINGNETQFRKFATLREEQGKGYGTALMQFILKTTAELATEIVWCNARADKTYFYEKFGMQKTDKQFTKGGIDYIIMEKQLKVKV